VNQRAQWVIVGVLVVLVGLGLYSAKDQLSAELFPVKIGNSAPDFQANPMAPGAAAKTLADYTGDVVLLNIWATWCGPCRKEMPEIERLHQQLGPKGLRVVAVSVDVAGMEDAINTFTEDMKLSFEILHNPERDIERRYQTTGVPETFIISRDGRIRRRVIGAPMGVEAWDQPASIAYLERLLAEPRPR
jgi:cytochrome c biogenesis protein CcmG/thiol:disulfide interchange protein DsbE